MKILLLLINLLWLSTSATAATIEAQRIENLIQQKLPNTSVGVFLQEAKTGKILYERRAEETFLPASTAKLISSASSLFVLGPQFKYETAFKAHPNVAKSAKTGILKGNLYLEFRGDPSFTSVDLQKMLQDLKAYGVKQIQGNIIVDNSLFQGKNNPYGWIVDDLNWFFAAPVSTVILNENKIKLIVKPNKTLGEKANVYLAAEETLPIKISQDVVSVTETDAEENCELNIAMDQENNLKLKGCWPAKEKEDEIKLAVKNPDLALQQELKRLLKAENIILTGKILYGELPNSSAGTLVAVDPIPSNSTLSPNTKSADSKQTQQPLQPLQTLALHESVPLETLMIRPLQDSNNLYSESLVKTMGVKQYQQGTFQAGLKAIKDTLNSKFGMDTKALRLQDGSGGSRYDAVSPAQLGRILYVMYHNPEFSKAFLDALPHSGNSGTLKKRMEAFDVNGVVRAKTGTMTGVSALAGYLTNPSKEDLIFVIMINNSVVEAAVAKQLENDLCKLFVQS